MKNLTFKLTVFLFLLILGGTRASGQNTQTVNSETLSKHGLNSAGTSQTTEATDSVTTGSSTRYYVIPDVTANPNYGGASHNVPLTGSLTSHFKWNVANKTGSADTITTGVAIDTVGTYGSYTNYRKVTWKGTGTLDLTFQEVSASGCGGNTEKVPIAIIAAPTLTYPAAAGKEDTCKTGTAGSLNIQVTKRFWVTYSSPIGGSNQGIRMIVDITRANNNADAGDDITVADNLEVTFTRVNNTSGYFTIPTTTEFDDFDTYNIKLVSISDRISRKGRLWNAASGNLDFAYYVYPVPTTGTIYHLPNM